MADSEAAASAVRIAEPRDSQGLSTAFEVEGYGLPVEQLERYVAEQAAGTRLMVVAETANRVVGYLTLSWTADYPDFRRGSIPEIQDLNVLPSQRRRGVATLLLDRAEGLAAERGASFVGLGVGLYHAYGPAQRLYVLRGYVPDGMGIASGQSILHGGEMVPVDDTLVLRLVKPVRQGESWRRRGSM